MKKIVLFLLLILLTSCSCQNDVISYQDGFDITVPDEIKAHLINQEIPSLHFAYSGIINVASFSTKSKYILAQNDHYLVSDAFGHHLDKFENRFINTSVQVQINDKEKARFGQDFLPLDPGEESFEYMRVAWDLNGTRYSYQFRTFLSNGKRYYIYTYNTNLTVSLEIPLMVIKQDDIKRLVLINLPYDTKYEVHANLELNALINKDTYLDEMFYTFLYPDHLKDLTEKEKESAIWEWYQQYCEGYKEGDKYYFTYLGEKFQLIFNKTKIDKKTKQTSPAFMIKYS